MTRELRLEDAEALLQLRRRDLADAPLAFASSAANAICSSPEAVREQIRGGPNIVLPGAFRPQRVGPVVLSRHRRQKARTRRTSGAFPPVDLSVSSAAPKPAVSTSGLDCRCGGTEPDPHSSRRPARRRVSYGLGGRPRTRAMKRSAVTRKPRPSAAQIWGTVHA
jgi:hypothetical protein